MANHALGDMVLALCRPIDEELLRALLAWMKPGPIDRVDIIASVLRSARSTLIYDQPGFISDVLDTADLIGEEAGAAIRSALWATTLSGTRSTSPGVPFKEDIELRDYATEKLSQLSRADPSYTLFSMLLREAERGIDRQLQEKRMMDIDDELEEQT
jgi:hypothetical protein